MWVFGNDVLVEFCYASFTFFSTCAHFFCFGFWLWVALDWGYELLFSIYISILYPSM